MTDETPKAPRATTAQPVNIQTALTRVMADVQAVSKDSRNQSQGFNFRGIDAVMNTVGPALREHGVIVLPEVIESLHRDFSTSKGALMHECLLTVRFTFVGPDGSTLSCSTQGESADSGDKATTKAHSVAFRTALLQALCIPTDEPDPDETTVERGASGPKAEPKPGVTPAVDVAVQLGWPSSDDQQAAWNACLGQFAKLSPDESADVLAWGKQQKLDPLTLTMAQAAEWKQRLDMAMEEPF